MGKLSSAQVSTQVKSVLVVTAVVGLALPAAAQECGEPATQTAGVVDGGWALDDGPLATLSLDAGDLRWEEVPGSTVETVSVDTGTVQVGEASVSAAVVVPGGPSGLVPDLTDATRITFRGIAGCDLVLETLELDTVEPAPRVAVLTPVGDSVATVEPDRPRTPDRSHYVSWRRRVR